MSVRNANNGMITKIWGPPLWKSLEYIVYGYPEKEPTYEQKQDYLTFFIKLGSVLPCRFCRDSYKEFITTGETNLTLDALKNREALTTWLFLLRERVNKKLGVTYGISKDILDKRTEACRASCAIKENQKGCIMPADDKARAYRISQIRDAPLILNEMSTLFIPYAKERGLVDKDFDVALSCNNNSCIHDKIADLNCIEWCDRNARCWQIIDNMRQNKTPSLELDGPYKDLPTIQETKLILLMSTNLCFEELNKIINILANRNMCNKNSRIYKLSKPI